MAGKSNLRKHQKFSYGAGRSKGREIVYCSEFTYAAHWSFSTLALDLIRTSSLPLLKITDCGPLADVPI